MKMLRKFNLHKNILRMRSNKTNLFSYTNKTFTTESLDVLQSKLNRNSQEGFQVKIFKENLKT